MEHKRQAKASEASPTDQPTAKTRVSVALTCSCCAACFAPVETETTEEWVRAKTLKITKTIHRCVERSSNKIHLPQTAPVVASSVVTVWSNPSTSRCSDSDTKPTPPAATHFMLGLQSFSDQLHLEVVGMKEYDKQVSLGSTCRKAFSNTQTRTQYYILEGRGKGRVLTYVYIWYNIHIWWKLVFYWAFVFQNNTNSTNMHTRRLPDPQITLDQYSYNV